MAQLKEMMLQRTKLKDYERFGIPTVSCKLCGHPTHMLGTKLCDPCWELEVRIRQDPEIARKVLDSLDKERG